MDSYLRPYYAENIMGDGLFVKQGGNHETVNGVSMTDINRKKLSSFIRSCIGDVIYDRFEKAKIK
jgi:hypothetical protein